MATPPRPGARPKTGGRTKGTPNKLPAFRDEILKVYEELGGTPAFTAWARKHQTSFYTTIAPKILPKEIIGTVDAPLPLSIRLTKTSP